MFKTTYRAGTYNAICEVCGFQHKADEMRERYDGLFVCAADYEGKHPLDYTRVVIDKQYVDRPSPEPDPIYINVNYIE
jgi:hypothetical protein